ncbi:MAG: glycosyltransferase family 2 protein [Elusimicrobia bacterium]|jgi:dolichol-phosphate mannosyltransferase|nr:glycosyltransferase family 2 protein [Elusimicrobiota bacterium]
MIHILLAAFNEEKAIGAVLNGVARALADGRYKVWVVDDGSTDGTLNILERWSQAVPLVIVRHKTNRGLGSALQTGFTALIPVLSPHDVVVTLDADNTHSPIQIPSLVQPVEDGRADLVVASRFVRGALSRGVPFIRRCLSVCASFLFRIFIPVQGLRDFTCGFRAIKGSLIKSGHEKWGSLVEEQGFAATAEILVKLRLFKPRIIEIPLILRYDRRVGFSKMRLGRTILRNFGVIFRFWCLDKP